MATPTDLEVATDGRLKADSHWRRIPERGSVFGIRFVVGFARVFGRRFASAFLRFVVVYYALFDGRTRRASRAYLARVGIEPVWGAVLRHLFFFARVTLDRYFFLCGNLAEFDIHLHGHELLVALSAAACSEPGGGRGAVLLGAHIGSFEAMRSLAGTHNIPISVVTDFGNAKLVNGILEQLSPQLKMRMIELDPARVTSVLDIKACIDRGELVSILADRLSASERRHVEVDFLGAKALLPSGPFLLASTLRCPVYVVYALFTPPNRYDIYCESFLDVVHLPRATRQQALQQVAQQFAERLELMAKRAPYNWFNFYDFWRKP